MENDKMDTAKKIREFYESRKDSAIKKLQNKCNHPSSTWCQEYWAIAHSTGRSLKICDVCEKTLEIK